MVMHIRKYIRLMKLRKAAMRHMNTSRSLYLTYSNRGYFEGPARAGNPFMNDVLAEMRCHDRIMRMVNKDWVRENPFDSLFFV